MRWRKGVRGARNRDPDPDREHGRRATQWGAGSRCSPSYGPTSPTSTTLILFDTCHAHAGGENLDDVIERVLDAVGTIDLVHANDSRDPPGTGADRHANFSEGNIPDEQLLAMVQAAGAPAVICETPWPQIKDDVAYLRENLR